MIISQASDSIPAIREKRDCNDNSLPCTAETESPVRLHCQLRSSPRYRDFSDRITFCPNEIRLEGNENPRNWSSPRKWSTTAIISLMGFISPLGSSIIVPGAPIMDHHWILHSRELSLLPVSFFVLGLGVGPFLLAPASELKGRQPIFLVSSFVFVIFNIGCAVVDRFAALCLLRFLAGAAGSTGPSLGAGSIGDLFAPAQRGRAQSFYGLGPLLGPVCGAIAGAWIAQSSKSFRWLLWFLTILSAAILIIVALFLHETYGPVLLRRKIEKRAKEHLEMLDGIECESLEQTQSLKLQRERILRNFVSEDRKLASTCSAAGTNRLGHRVMRPFMAIARFAVPGVELRKRTHLALSRPFRLLFTNPICAIFSLYMGVVYGIIFIFITQHPLLFQKRQSSEEPPPSRLPTYNFSTGVASLTYLGLGLGFLVAATINVIWQDVIYARLMASNGVVGWRFVKLSRLTARRSKVPSLAFNARRPENLKTCLPHHLDLNLCAGNATSDQGTMTTTIQFPEPLRCEAKDGQRESTPNAPSIPSLSKPSFGVATTAISSVPVDNVKAGRPEYRLPLCLLGMFILPSGLLVFGWTADARAHFMLPLLGSFLVGVGSILPFQGILVYLVDAFVPYSASATACAVLVRCVLAAIFPLFSERLFVTLGFGWGSSLLALISALGIPVPILMFCKGEALRSRFTFEG